MHSSLQVLDVKDGVASNGKPVGWADGVCCKGMRVGAGEGHS